MLEEWKTLIILLCFLFLPPGALAAPDIVTVDGSCNDESSVILSGSGFGTKDPVAPLVWDNFEDQLVGSHPDNDAIVGLWETVEDSESAQIVSDVVYGGSKAVHWDNGQNGRDFMVRSLMTNSSRIYISDKRRYSGIFIDTTNQKFLYAYTENKSPSVVPSLAYSSLNGGLMGVQNCYATKYFNGNFLPNTWRSEEWELQNSSGINQNDGIARYTLNGQTISNQTDIVYQDNVNPGYLADFYLSNYSDNTAQQIWQDDIYVDNTWARVQACLGLNWDNREICEIQPPIIWSQNSITFTFNKGSFSVGQQVYLYVVDSTGTPNSNGYPVNIEADGGDTTAPVSPVFLTVR